MEVRDIVNRFGGQTALAKDLGKGPSTIAYWVKENTIPSKWHAPLLDLARKQGVDLTTSDLLQGMTLAEVQPPRLPVGQFPGTLIVGDAEIKCYVLDNGERVISRVGATEFISDIQGHGDLEGYLRALSLRPYLPKRWQDELIDFTLPEVTHKRVAGLRAETFFEICRGFMEARDEGELTETQMAMAKRAAQFVIAVAKVGLIALIDEVTGYQYERATDALQWKLKLYLEEEMREWEKTFPDELWQEFGRLTGWKEPISSRPKYWGKLVMEMVYGYLDADVAQWLRDHAPTPRHGQNYHQWLTSQYGLKKLTEHIWLLIGVASTCNTMPELRQKMAYKFGKVPMQLTIFTDPPIRSN
jgi:hypothetical protein